MKVPIPESVSREIAEVAVQRARENFVRRGWSPQAQNSLSPVFGEGVVGIRTDLNYLSFQNRGIRSFVMWWAEGRIIPMPDGPIRATGVGQPGFVKVPSKTFPGVKVSVWRDQKWKHPGLKPKRFFENAISQAILEATPRLKERTMKALAGEEQGE
jgi:hypothetical protein